MKRNAKSNREGAALPEEILGMQSDGTRIYRATGFPIKQSADFELRPHRVVAAGIVHVLAGLA